MPKVETYDTPQVEAAPARTPLQRFNTSGAFGEAVARGGFNLAANMERIQAEDDNAMTKERISKYRDFSRARLYGDDDAFFNRKGRAAYDSRDKIRQELEGHVKELSKDLSPRQQRLFKSAAQQYVDRDLDGISKHSATARIDWLNGQDTATILSAQEDGSLYWNDNDAYATQIRKSLSNIAQRNGWSPEKREMEEKKYISAMHLSSIDNILQQNPREASEYFTKHRDDILPSLRDDVQKKIDDQTDAIWAQGEADRIRAGAGTLSDRQAAINEIDDPDRRKLVRQQVEHDWRVEQTAEQEAIADAYEAAANAIVVSGQSAQQWAQANPDQWEILPADTKAKLLSGGASEFNHQAYNTVTDLIIEGKTDQALKYLRTHPQLFTDTDYKSFSKTLTSRQTFEIDGFQSRQARFKAKIEPLGLGDDRTARLTNELERSYRDYQRIHQKEPDAAAVDDMIDDLVLKTYDSFWFDPFHSDQRAFQQVQDELEKRTEQFVVRFGRQPTAVEEAQIRQTILENYDETD